MKQTAMQELLEKYGHLLPDEVEELFMEKERRQLCRMYIQGRKDHHLDFYPEKHAKETYNEFFG